MEQGGGWPTTCDLLVGYGRLVERAFKSKLPVPEWIGGPVCWGVAAPMILLSKLPLLELPGIGTPG